MAGLLCRPPINSEVDVLPGRFVRMGRRDKRPGMTIQLERGARLQQAPRLQGWPHSGWIGEVVDVEAEGLGGAYVPLRVVEEQHL